MAARIQVPAAAKRGEVIEVRDPDPASDGDRLPRRPRREAGAERTRSARSPAATTASRCSARRCRPGSQPIRTCSSTPSPKRAASSSSSGPTTREFRSRRASRSSSADDALPGDRRRDAGARRRRACGRRDGAGAADPAGQGSIGRGIPRTRPARAPAGRRSQTPGCCGSSAASAGGASRPARAADPARAAMGTQPRA